MTEKIKEKWAIIDFIQKSDISFINAEIIMQSINCEKLRVTQILFELCYENVITPVEFTVWGVPVKYYKKQ